jgi:hypothetical protein
MPHLFQLDERKKMGLGVQILVPDYPSDIGQVYNIVTLISRVKLN